MKFIFDYGPLVGFGLGYFFGDIYVATEMLIACCVAVVAAGWLIDRRINKVHLATAVVAAALGGLTLAFHDPAFIKLKPSLLYGLFALVLLGSQVIGKQVLLARIPQQSIVLPDALWRKINLAWAAFFIGLAILNLYVANHFSEANWVKFKLFGCTGLTFVFLLGHLPFVARYLPVEAAAAPAEESRP